MYKKDLLSNEEEDLFLNGSEDFTTNLLYYYLSSSDNRIHEFLSVLGFLCIQKWSEYISF